MKKSEAANWDLPEEELDRIYREGYLRIPEDPEIGELGAMLLAELLADDPPWEVPPETEKGTSA